MKIADAIDRLNDMAEVLRDMPDDEMLTNPSAGDIEALELAVRVLTTLEDNRAKAEEIIAIEKICSSDALEDCEGCPYHMQGCTFKMFQDAERLLGLAYLQGGTTNDET